jgi:hypothetical protein
LKKKSRRFFLPPDDFDIGLVKNQIKTHLVEGLGFCGLRSRFIIDPAEIVKNVRSQKSKRD